MVKLYLKSVTQKMDLAVKIVKLAQHSYDLEDYT